MRAGAAFRRGAFVAARPDFAPVALAPVPFAAPPFAPVALAVVAFGVDFEAPADALAPAADFAEDFFAGAFFATGERNCACAAARRAIGTR